MPLIKTDVVPLSQDGAFSRADVTAGPVCLGKFLVHKGVISPPQCSIWLSMNSKVKRVFTLATGGGTQITAKAAIISGGQSFVEGFVTAEEAAERPYSPLTNETPRNECKMQKWPTSVRVAK